MLLSFHLLEHVPPEWQRCVHFLPFLLQGQLLLSHFLLQLQLGIDTSGLLEANGSVAFTPVGFMDLSNPVEPAFVLESSLEWVGCGFFSRLDGAEVVDLAP